jgi:hypothetical protein
VMADATRKKIGDIKVGDYVLATDPVTGRTSFRVVTETMVHDDNDLLDLVVRTDDGLETIHTTDHHRIWDATRQAWSLAIDLGIGDELRTVGDDRAFVEQLVRIPGHSPMLDLTVDIDHTFYVDGGTGAFPVHNQNCAGVSFTEKQLQKKYKHAGDFGLSENYNPAAPAKFLNALELHIDSSQAIQGTYKGIAVTHYLEPSTGLNVIVSTSGEFISGWKLSPTQFANVIFHGGLV